MSSAASSWRISATRAIAWGRGVEPMLMAVVNVTPDSFSDGGDFLDPAKAIDAALASIDEGAAIVDIGGESTRPGAAAVDAREQIRRVIPVIEGVRAKREAAISVDTTSAEVARAALDAGAEIINDTSAGADDAAMLPLAASRGCGVVLMHREKPPAKEVWSHERTDDESRGDRAPGEGTSAESEVVLRVRNELARRVDAAVAVGVPRERIAIDPGLGFGKSVAGNFALLSRLEQFESIGAPILIGASRKSFIGAASGVEEPRERLAGTLAAAVIAVLHGAAILRVHDVAAHRQALAVLERCRRWRAAD